MEPSSQDRIQRMEADGVLIPKVVDIDPFHRGDFCRQSGARCVAVPDTASLRDAAGDKKRPALRVGHIGPPGALRRLPAIWESGVPHRAARRGPACASRLMGPAG